MSDEETLAISQEVWDSTCPIRDMFIRERKLHLDEPTIELPSSLAEEEVIDFQIKCRSAGLPPCVWTVGKIGLEEGCFALLRPDHRIYYKRCEDGRWRQTDQDDALSIVQARLERLKVAGRQAAKEYSARKERYRAEFYALAESS